MTDIARDLFDWADRRPPEAVVDFDEKRRTLPRWRELRKTPLAGYDRAMARKSGKLAPAPVLRFPVIHPASHLAYVDGPARAQR
jgi:hypothetical protein